jgi:uncharacterized protein
MLVCKGPESASQLLVLAPGDECRLTDATPTLIADALSDAGIRVVRFAFPDCDSSDGTLRDTLVAGLIREAAALKSPGQQLILGGLSRGARVSATLVRELSATGLVAFAYPFHGRNNPNPGDRVTQLASVPVPTLVCQGTRDSRGNRQQVRGYHLPSHITVHWLDDANHALEPRARSGHTQVDQLARASAVAVAFLRGLA